jgi:hypothetical protein
MRGAILQHPAEWRPSPAPSTLPSPRKRGEGLTYRWNA